MIDAVGEGVDAGRVGERVWVYFAAWQRRWGTAAEYTRRARRGRPCRFGAPDELGAILGIPALTAHRCLHADGPFRTVLVAGGAGAVGHAAIELARYAGARVIATVSSAEKAELARDGRRARGRRLPPGRCRGARPRARAGRPGRRGRRWARTSSSTSPPVAPHAAIASYAATPDDVAEVPVRRLMTPNLVLRFVLVYTIPRDALATAVADVSAAVAAGALTTLPRAPLPARARGRGARRGAGRRRRQGAYRHLRAGKSGTVRPRRGEASMATRSTTPTAPGSGRFQRPGQPQRQPRTKVRWVIVSLCFAGLTVNYVDRANLSVALPKMSDELGFGPGVEGLVLGAFFASYAFFQLRVGHLVDRLGARIVFAVAGLWWSIFTAATALANSVASLIAFRLALGVGEAGGYPASAKAVSEWFPVRERAFATSIYDSGARAGTALALPVVTALVAWLGWRGSFATTTGVLIAATGGSYVPALVLSGGLSLLGAFAYLVIVGRIEPLPVRS